MSGKNNKRNNNSKSNRNNQQESNNNNNRSCSSSSSIHRNNQMSSLPTSILPIPASKARKARKSGQLSKQTKQSIEDSTSNRNKFRQNKIEDLKEGAPYNECNSFFSQCSCDQILRELTLALKSQPDLDINIHPSGYKIRGRKFIDQFMIEFQIEMFYTTNKHKNYPNHILVEFQRRNGDGFVFQQFIHSIFKELQNSNIITFSKFPVTNNCYLSPTPMNGKGNNNNNNNNDNDEEEKKQDNTHNTHNSHNRHWRSNHNPSKQIDQQTLKMLIGALFAGDNQMCRSASSYLANNVANNQGLVYDIIKLEPHIITKFSDLLLKCVDPQIVRSIGCTLYHMLQQSDKLKNEALKLNVKTVCKKVYKRWTEPVETRYGSNNKYVIRVIPSMQVAQRMNACIEVLE